MYAVDEDYNKPNVLFAGCSITAACGLNSIEDSWSKKLYNKIKDFIDIGNYHNASISGSPISEIIINIFKYINTRKNPNYIFLLLPNISRDCIFMRCETDIQRKTVSNFNWNMYYLLDQYCTNNNIKLFSMTWDIFVDGANNFFVNNDTNELLNTEETFKGFDSFYTYSKDNFIKQLYNECSINNNYNLLGNDGSHPNFQFHNVYSNLFFD